MVTEKCLPASPRESANLISKLFFCWPMKLFRLGSKRDLELDDLYRALPEDRSKCLGDQLAEEWRLEVKKSSIDSKSKPSFLVALFKVFGLRYLTLGIFPFIQECGLKLLQSIFLGYLIRYFANEFEESEGYLFTTGVVLCSAFFILQQHPFIFECCHVGMQMRIATSSLIYRKAVKLSQASLATTTIGQLINFLSSDVNRFDSVVTFAHYIWVAPLQLLIVIYILWGYLGPYSFAGASVLLLLVPLQIFIGQIYGILRCEVAGKTDQRLRILNDLIGAIRVIKMYAWEFPFSKIVTEARKHEMKVIRKTAYLRAIHFSLNQITSKLTIFVTLLAYVLTGNYLTAEKVFVTLSMFNAIKVPVTYFLPYGISQVAEVLISIKRIEAFLLLEESQTAFLHHKYPEGVPQEHLDDAGVDLTNINAKWSLEPEEMPILLNITFECKRGQLTGILGPVGSGKSCLLQVILGELPISSGSIDICGRIAFVSQVPSIFAGSIRQNILFGRPYDETWYREVIKVCELTTDLSLLPYSDFTIVGEKGISLSGGQKARVCLARAVYANADIYLLDDPLSAVDASVARNIFENCITGVLQNKACILVTHQLHFLQSANQLILLNNGKVDAQGTYTDLLESGINLTQLLSPQDEIPEEKVRKRTASEFGIREPPEPETFHSSNPLTKQEKKEYGTFRYIKKESMNQEEELVITPEQETRRNELQSVGEVGLKVVWKYVHAGSSYCTLFIILILLIATQFLSSGSDYWLQHWTSVEQHFTFNSTSNGQNLMDGQSEKKRRTEIFIYCLIIGSLLITSVFRAISFFSMCVAASVNLHKRLFDGVLRASMSFFELNPTGRILNRFSKDISTIDELIPATFFDTIGIFLDTLGTLLIVSIINPILLAPSFVLAILFYYIRRFYLRTARSVKRLEGIARSPIFAQMSSTLYGLTTIRAFRVEKDFEDQFDAHQDLHSSVFYMFLATGRWLGVCIDWISLSFVAIVSYSFMLTNKTGSQVGLAVASAMNLMSMLQWGIRQSAETENLMVSVERVLDYAEVKPEPPLESKKDKKPPPDWPSQGEIYFDQVYLKYDDDAPVLKNITCFIHPKEKIGVVGRTGAGKSSLITTLFRITDPYSGSIKIDGINILEIGLHDLRSKISIIPQDPILFIGTLRKNLDPFSDYSDNDIWNVLEEVKLIEAVKDMSAGLDTEISEGGSNFSVGQRQLICLGRAILKRNKILVLDEATANVDPDTDALIQNTIRLKFADCTVLTIAHRLHTVMDSDRIIVLDAGEIEEFEEPHLLLQHKNSSLSQLVHQTGSTSVTSLLQIAETAFENRRSLQSLNL